MNREDIIRIYEKANGWSPEGWDKTVDELERFAALVAAAEREVIANLVEQMGIEGYGTLAIAAAIRARGQE